LHAGITMMRMAILALGGCDPLILEPLCMSSMIEAQVSRWTRLGRPSNCRPNPTVVAGTTRLWIRKHRRARLLSPGMAGRAVREKALVLRVMKSILVLLCAARKGEPRAASQDASDAAYPLPDH
jgi:hypothetical protein